ncbi:Xaa-Pro peptidase family protein [Marinobacter sp. M216]|uniref:Xaa-Pro peptidase family protein n=1 Tax=Marinobacter albus TaxID=3030833 RepID=A0ABT7HAN4_9GAMM|nr:MULTISPECIES: Xaa-Pro peptidase family protein [unclassified Marinobacter]MBW7470687.1 Xaa-Pro peptidase family protein [Marinobacter sp. F4218]MDK9557044.1 Xaa-Pro peptidase family protein [Marinobacter sp. M216]
MDFNAYQKALSLQSRGSECPFPPGEYDQRLSRVRNRMEAEDIDALLLTDCSDIFYLTGYSTFEVSVHVALVVTASSLLLQVPSIEMGPAMVTTRVREVSGYRWEGIGEVLGPLIDALNDSADTVGIDAWHGSLRQGVLEGLKARLPGVRFVDAGGLVKKVRLVKSEAEIGFLRHSASITAEGLRAAVAAVRPGMTDNDVAAVGAKALLEAGSEFMSMQPIVTTGVRSSVIHTNHKRCRIEPDEPVFLEFGSAWHRYTAPMMQTVVAGSPSADMRRVFDGCRRVVDALLAAVRPGTTFDSAAQSAEKALAPLAGMVFFSGVFGYTVGAQFPPSWVEGSGFIARGGNTEFRPGMVFHLPICLRVPGQWGIGCSETVLVTNTGAEPITANPWSLNPV